MICNILETLRNKGELAPDELDGIIRARSAQAHDGRRVFAKKHVLPYYLRMRDEGGETWKAWNVDAALDKLFVRTLQMKPRRTASGVATITVITKPWPCANSCVYCPNDPRMPKSYLSDEPACQRAERNRFHPYLQVASRLRTLEQMGHETAKVELIVLGGTWLDYPADYRTWFVGELFRALNDDARARREALDDMDAFMAKAPIAHDDERIEELQRCNESAEHRVVGLVMETRPDTVTPEALASLRKLGCTKLQLGVQSVDDAILRMNGRRETAQDIAESLALVRLFGFKVHAHFMVNLLGATPESDIADYRVFATDERFQPDEVKLYPCALVAGTKLVDCYENGSWRPYSEEELVDVLGNNLLDTPPFMRISRMIRDISARDILVGNKKTNLRQMVETRLAESGEPVREIRFREIATGDVDPTSLALEDVTYRTTATDEHFLQWVAPDGRIAGFLRLSLPHPDAVAALGGESPIGPGEAMIREVHVYGRVARLHAAGSTQHIGLGKQLVNRAAAIAREAGYGKLNVISAIGTREYYRKLGFEDAGLYQRLQL